MFFAPVLRTRAYTPSLRSFDRAFERFYNEAVGGSTNVQQDDKAWTITLDVPGVTREQLDIGIDANVVRVSTAEGAARQYKAAWQLPQDVDVAASEARLENGVLTLKLAKKVPVDTTAKLAVQ